MQHQLPHVLIFLLLSCSPTMASGQDTLVAKIFWEPATVDGNPVKGKASFMAKIHIE